MRKNSYSKIVTETEKFKKTRSVQNQILQYATFENSSFGRF